MKKFFAGILAILYLSTSMGASIHLHYCMGKLISWGFVNHDSRYCDYCGMPKFNGQNGNGIAKKGCCSDEHKQLKTDKDQKLPVGEYEFLKYFPDVSYHPVLSLPEFPASSGLYSLHFPNAPPDACKQPLFLRHCNFRL